jgi:4-alpha-glucanotransferase
VLLHPTSLPGPNGNGDLGPSAHRFVDFLASARQSLWQMLPVVPPGSAYSPYHATSAFAGSPLLLSLEQLARRGLLDPARLRPTGQPGRVRFEVAWRFREPRLREAFVAFEARRDRQRGFADYSERNQGWLSDYALFSALREAHGGRVWTAWEAPLRDRRAAALAAARRALDSQVRYHQFLQFEFERQWSELRAHCRERGVALMGDVPIFVAHDSADVWAHPELFQLDRQGRPRVVAGCPPDYFSRDGQLWGNPLYNWHALRARDYDWWVARLAATLARFDTARLDHFIGFVNYWEVPARARTARGGRWVEGPGAHFFERVREKLGRLPLLAEDLGVVTPRVEALRDRFGLPGMKVLHFAFEEGPGGEAGRPHHFKPNCVVYTGTHDNDTTVGWFRKLGGSPRTRRQRERLLRYLGSDGAEIHWDLIRLAWMSVARTAIVPVQDLLGLGSQARMNTPGSRGGNWGFRLRKRELTPEVAARLAELTATFGRLPST